jgi:hypothetical protein
VTIAASNFEITTDIDKLNDTADPGPPPAAMIVVTCSRHSRPWHFDENSSPSTAYTESCPSYKSGRRRP